MASRAERRAQRRKWPVRVVPLREERPVKLGDEVTAEERMAMMWQLTQEAWAIAGREIPDYERSDIPIKLLKRGEHDDREGH
jgi:hypothetical protein